MSQVVNIVAKDGTPFQYVDDGSPMQGGMKDVYFSPDKSYVVAIFKDLPDLCCWSSCLKKGDLDFSLSASLMPYTTMFWS